MSDYFHCNCCGTRVALLRDFVSIVDDFVNARFFTGVFNVEVAEDEQVSDGMNLATTYCVKCKKPIGWKVIAASQPSRSQRVGGFYMKLRALSFSNDVKSPDFLFGDKNEQAPKDQDGGADEEQDHDQNGGGNDQNGGGNDQDGGSNQQVPNEQDYQDGDSDQQVPYEQDLGANEQNADQDGGSNEQNHDQDGRGNQQVPNEQDLGANEQNADQDRGDNEQNQDQDGGPPKKRMKI